MPDIEKIKKGLEACGSDSFNLDKGCDTCPYYDFSPHHDYDFDFGCIKVLARDTLELLKEQEEVKPKQVELYGKEDWYGLVCVCPDCKAEWMSDEADTHFCPKCGKPVRWE